MKKLWLTSLGFVLLLGCATPQQQQQSIGIAALTLQTGEQTVQNMTQRYNDTRSHCNDVEEMAFKCTGVLFRGTVNSPNYHAWNPAPGSYDRNGVSFSYLRTDAKFNTLAYDYNHGFVFFPENNRPSGKDTIEVRCAFPVDGWTGLRGSDACGQYPGYPESRPCQVQGVRTAAQWFTHFQQYGPEGRYLCGFKVNEAGGIASAEAFYETLKAMKLLGVQSFNGQNELILTPWEQNIGDRLPIEAFFYTTEGAGGLAGAQTDQQDFYKVTGILLPIIRMTLPAVATADVTFEHFANEQWGPGN